VATGEYIYTFKTTAPAGFDPTLTNRVAVYGSRTLTAYDLGTYNATATFDFVPAGGTPTPRDVVRDADCNSCHTSLPSTAARVWVWPCASCATSRKPATPTRAKAWT
jgi:OmcA/MtrC family decaheme c-type cytochrome